MLATSLTAAVVGVEAHLVRVETDTAAGFPKFTMIGLPDSSIKESEGRIRAALRNCGYGFKWDRRITVSMAPASLRKAGSSFDLATAIGLLAADGALPGPPLSGVLIVGELALDGAVRAVPGVLPMMLMARRQGLTTALVPLANAREASLVSGVRVHPVACLPEAVDLAAAPDRSPPPVAPAPAVLPPAGIGDMADIRGQMLARRALEIAAAGGHNLLLAGPPGAGKTMLARRLPGILPPLSREEALETTAIHSAWGAAVDGLIAHRPFRAPHHTLSDAAMVGGGSIPRPGEISLAHNGVLFLDELPEFRRRVLESLRQPLEERTVTLCRVRGSITLPARFQLVAAMNPCPCGGGPSGTACRCTPGQLFRYQQRISGPLLDRMDLRVTVPPVPYAELAGAPGEGSAAVAARVAAARALQAGRNPGAAANAALDGPALRNLARSPGATALLERAVHGLSLSARAHDRLLRVGRTLADLEGAATIDAVHMGEALQFRGFDLSDDMAQGVQSLG